MLVAATLLVQLALVCWTFPLRELFTETPLFHIDSAFHWYQMQVAHGLAASHHLVGYDPYFAAGYLGGVNFNASAKLPAVASVALSPWLSAVLVYKLYSFVSAVLAPACVPLAMKWLGLERRAAIAASVLGLLLWWLSGLRWFHTAGMVSFVAGSYLSLPYIALAVRYVTRPGTLAMAAALVIAGALAMFYHPLFPIPVAFCVPLLLLALWDEVRRAPLLILLLVVPALCLAANLFWVLPTLQHSGYADSALSPYQKAVDLAIVWQEAIGQIGEHARGSRLNLLLWFGAIWACLAGRNTRERRIGLALALGALALMLFAALGAALPFVGTLQPNRFSAAAYLLLCIPAGLGAAAMLDSLRTGGWPRIAAAGSCLLLVVSAAFFGRELARELSFADIAHHGAQPPEVRGVGPYSAWVVNWLKTHTTPAARVLFETSRGRIHDHAQMAGYYAVAAERELIGGPYPYLQPVDFWDGQLLGRPIESFSVAEFERSLDAYNIGWIIVHSDSARKFLDAAPGVQSRERHGPLAAYVVDRPHNFFAQGAGNVVARGYNHLRLSGVSGRSVILKYRHVPGLTSQPHVRVEPVMLPGASQPFIRLIDPPAELTLSLH